MADREIVVVVAVREPVGKLPAPMFPLCTPLRLISPKEPAASLPPEVWMSSSVSVVGVPKVGLHVGFVTAGAVEERDACS